MTRGTLTYIGNQTREVDLLLTRLEKEGYEIKKLKPSVTVYGHAIKAKPLAILIGETISQSVLEGICGIATKAGSRGARLPVILVGNDEIDPKLTNTKGLGEVWRLHQISLAEAIKRLRFAIQLTQLAN